MPLKGGIKCAWHGKGGETGSAGGWQARIGREEEENFTLP